tara:strand:- start:2954 stop:3610 length:657 start_codon:yes stop_codon:yes gene_type:complete
MADLKISQLPAATTPLAGTEVLPIVQAGSTVQVSVDDLTAGKTVLASIVTATTVNATTFDTNVAAAGVTLVGNTLAADGTDANIDINITPKGTGAVALADALLSRPTLKDYAIEGSAIGSTGATRTFDLSVANFFSATLDQACTFTFSNPPASGNFGCFVLELTNGGAFVITYPASVDFIGGVAPTLTAAGVDQLVFTTRDGGTTYFCFVAGLDIKSP